LYIERVVSLKLPQSPTGDEFRAVGVVAIKKKSLGGEDMQFVMVVQTGVTETVGGPVIGVEDVNRTRKARTMIWCGRSTDGRTRDHHERETMTLTTVVSRQVEVGLEIILLWRPVSNLGTSNRVGDVPGSI